MLYFCKDDTCVFIYFSLMAEKLDLALHCRDDITQSSFYKSLFRQMQNNILQEINVIYTYTKDEVNEKIVFVDRKNMGNHDEDNVKLINREIIKVIDNHRVCWNTSDIFLKIKTPNISIQIAAINSRLLIAINFSSKKSSQSSQCTISASIIYIKSSTKCDTRNLIFLPRVTDSPSSILEIFQ